jgi:alpha-N-arabinofuranosidase
MNSIHINTEKIRFKTAEDLYGIFFEDINRAGDGGLYPEMIRNRSFEDSIPPEGCTEDSDGYSFTSPQGWNDQFHKGEGLTRWILSNHTEETDIPAWYAKKGRFSLDSTDTLSANREVSLLAVPEDGNAEILNRGYAGMYFSAGEPYRFYCFLKGKVSSIRVSLCDSEGTLAEGELTPFTPSTGAEGNHVCTAAYTDPKNTAAGSPDAPPQGASSHDRNGTGCTALRSGVAGYNGYTAMQAVLTVTRDSAVKTPDPKRAYHGPMADAGINNCSEMTGFLRLSICADAPVHIGFTSLMPVHTFKDHGLRTDIAEMIAGLHPKFMRFPGGCIVEGFTKETIWRFHNEVGPVWERPSHQLLWHYRTTNGLGYHEFLQFCEDLGMEPMYVCNCGMTCQGRRPRFLTGADLDEVLEDTMDALEYALGGEDTKWGALRASMGHPAPFHMTYLEIGNENFGPEYEKRYRIFYDRIHERYPQIRIVANCHIEKNGLPCDIVDEHFYDTAEFFAQNADFYAGYDREGKKIFIGEQSVNRGYNGQLFGALGEAMFLIGAEQNQDIVELMSYAPLLENVNYMAWFPNLILFNQKQAFGIPSYYVWKLFGARRGQFVCDVEDVSERAPLPLHGGLSILGKPDVEYRALLWNGKTAEFSHLLMGQRESLRDGAFVLRGPSPEQRADAKLYGAPADEVLAIFGEDDAVSFDAACEIRVREEAPVVIGLFTGLIPPCVYVPDETKPPETWNPGAVKPLLWTVENGKSRVYQQQYPHNILLSEADCSLRSGDFTAFRAVCDGRSVTLSIGGQVVNQFELPSYAVMKSVVTGTDKAIYVKCVNMGGTEMDIDISLDCEVGDEYLEESVSGKPDSINDFHHPENIAIHPSRLTGASRAFTYHARPYSVNVLTLSPKNRRSCRAHGVL